MRTPTNPRFNVRATKEHPVYVATGDMVIGPDEVHHECLGSGAVWWNRDTAAWEGTIELAEPFRTPPSQEVLDYVPPHVRLAHKLRTTLRI